MNPDKFYEEIWFKKWVAESEENIEPIIPDEIVDDVDEDYEDEEEWFGREIAKFVILYNTIERRNIIIFLIFINFLIFWNSYIF